MNLKVRALDPLDYSCNKELKTCSVITDKTEKIYYDHGHYTLEGAKYLGMTIYKTDRSQVN